MKQPISIFGQVLKTIPRAVFSAAVSATKAERHMRGFTSWEQFVALLFCQFGRAHSLREISDGMRTCEGKLSHLGVKKAPARTTLAYANKNRPSDTMKQVFDGAYAHFAGDLKRVSGGKHSFRFKNPLVSIDSTTIDLCLAQFEWALFRQTKGAVKMHLLLDHDGYLPSFAALTDAKTADITVARSMEFAPGTILVFDRGYNDYHWFSRLTKNKVFFVTREKENACYEFVDETRLLTKREEVCNDIIRVKGSLPEPLLLRRIVLQDMETKEYLTFWTNHFNLTSTTIGAIYKDRWKIELFFKAIKTHLKIKTFLGTTPNAVWTQIWTALIALLVLAYMKLKCKYGWSLSNLVALVRMNLFTYRDLWAWLDNPFETPPQPPDWQLSLFADRRSLTAGA